MQLRVGRHTGRVDGLAFPRAPEVSVDDLRPVGVRWTEPMSRSARWFIGCAVVVAGLWCWAFSDPRLSVYWSLAAAIVTAMLVLIGAVSAGTARRLKPYGLSLRRPGRAIAALVALGVLTLTLGLTRAPMWVRFAQARPALLELARHARSGAPDHGARAGTYRVRTSFVDPQGVVYLQTTSTGIYGTAGFGYYEAHDATAPRSDQTVRYTHLTGPWWIVEDTDVP